MLMNDSIYKCRHALGSVGGCCVTCGEVLSYGQKHYSSEIRRLIIDEEPSKEMKQIIGEQHATENY